MGARKYLANIPNARYFWFLMLNLAISGLASTLLAPFIPVFLNEELGISVGAVSFLYFISGLLGTFSVFLAGWLIDRFGRKWVYLFGNSQNAMLPAALSRVTGFAQVLPFMSLNGIMDSASRASQTAIIADQVEDSQRNTAYGVSRIVSNGAWIVAPILGGLLLVNLAANNFQRLFLISAVLGVVGLLVFLFWVPESRRVGLEKPGLPKLSVLRDRDLLVLCVASMFSMLFYSQFYSLLPIFASKVRGLNGLEVGALFSISGVTVVALQFPTSTWLERIPKKTGYVLGIVVLAAGITSIAFAPTFHWLLVSCVLMTVGENMFFPIASVLVTEMAPEADRGMYVGVFSLFLSLGSNLSPLLGGTIWQVTGNAYLPWLLSPIYAAISVGLALFYELRPAKPTRTAGNGSNRSPAQASIV